MSIGTISRKGEGSTKLGDQLLNFAYLCTVNDQQGLAALVYV